MAIFYTDSASFERLTVTGSFQITGSLTLTGSSAGSGLTGSLLGTSSWANNAISSSFATTASAATSITFTPTSASYAVTSSYAVIAQSTLQGSVSASYALTASYASVAQTLLGSIESASYASTASYSTLITSGTSIYSTGMVKSGDADINNSVYIGSGAGDFSTHTSHSIFIGQAAGKHTIGAHSIAIGDFAGYGLIDKKSDFSINIGSYAGGTVTNASSSDAILIGDSAAYEFFNVDHTVAIGSFAGGKGSDTGSFQSQSILIGYTAGQASSRAAASINIGYAAGANSPSASKNIAIGYYAGSANSGQSAFVNNIVIGNNISIAKGLSNAVNIAGLIFGTGSYFNPDVTIFSGSQSPSTARVGILTRTPQYNFHVSGSGNYDGGLTVSSSLLVNGNITPSAGFTLIGTSSWAASASNAVSASWAPGGQGSVGPGTTNTIAKFLTSTTIGDSALVDGGVFISSSLPISGTSFTGSLFGTSSRALSASNAVSAAWAPGGGPAGLSGTGEANRIPLWTSAGSLGLSIVSQSADSSSIFVSGGIRIPFPLTESAESQIYGDILFNHSYMVSQNLGTLSGTTTARIDLRKGQWVVAQAATSAVITWQVVNSASFDKIDGFVLEYTSGGVATNTWMTNTTWPGGTAPTLTPSGGIDILTFTTYGGQRFHGVVNQRNIS